MQVAELGEAHTIQGCQFSGHRGGDIRRHRLSGHKGHLAETVTGSQVAQGFFVSLRASNRDADLAASDEIESCPRFALAADRLPPVYKNSLQRPGHLPE